MKVSLIELISERGVSFFPLLRVISATVARQDVKGVEWRLAPCLSTLPV